MTTLYPYKASEKYGKKEVALTDQLYDLTDLPELLLQSSNPNLLKKLLKKLRFAKRLSPFVIIAFCLPVISIYFFLTQHIDAWVLICSFVFLQVNILFIDFALWNYNEGKRILYIWLIEGGLAFPLLYWFFTLNDLPPYIY
jgi:hypothetical protein